MLGRWPVGWFVGGFPIGASPSICSAGVLVQLELLAVPNDNRFADMRTELEKERASLTDRLIELGGGEPGAELEFDHNFADSSQVTAERGELSALISSLHEALGEVEAALARLDEGTYGQCLSCGQPIEVARLEAMPTAKRCLACASRSKA